MRRYLRLLRIFYRYSLLHELEYRVNFLANALLSLFWVTWAVLGITVLFLHTDKLGEWSYPEVLMVAALFTLFNGLMDALWRPNVKAVISQVHTGSFDFVLTKPVNAQFMASLRNIVIWRFGDVLVGIGLIIYALSLLRITPGLTQIGAFIIMLVAGCIIVYSVWIMMVSLAFWFVKIENITEVFSAFYEAGRYPVTIYPGIVRGILTFVVPIAFVTTFPVSALLGKLDWSIMGIGIFLAIAFFLVSNRVWTFALAHYTSASS